MKILDFILIQRLKKRLLWLSEKGDIGLWADIMTGKITDQWFLEYPDYTVHFRYDRIYDKYVLATHINGNNELLLINKEYVVNLFD